ncbi:MAG: DNA translocase FtsK [Nitrospirota bacterium]|nr:DNA translocase FtsK [Nitrospirota bacterium]
MAAPKKEQQKHRHEILALTLFAAGLLLLLALVTYSASDPCFSVSRTGGQVRNAIGVLGSYLSDALLKLFGLGSYLLALFLFVYAAFFALGSEAVHPHLKKVGGIFLFASLVSLLGLQGDTVSFLGETVPSGGMLGQLFVAILVGSVSTTGAYIITVTVFMISLLLLAPFSLLAVWEWTQDTYHGIVRQLSLLNDIRKARAEKAREARMRQPEQPKAPPRIVEPLPQPRVAPRETREAKEKKEKPQKPVQATFEFMDDGKGGYKLPAADLLDPAPQTVKKISEKEMLGMSELLAQKLKDFGIEGRITQVHPGPVVTMFEFEPAPGVKVRSIEGLSDDLALSMKSTSVRIVSPLPGKGTVGIEVPNNSRETVYFRQIIESGEYQSHKSRLRIPLGKDIFGAPVVAQIEKMPHLLVAGATGSGKSVAVNAIIMALLMNARPNEVKLVMVDPKMLELSLYNDIPHLLTPVVTQPKKAAETLRAVVAEMERRYRQLADKGSKNIESYNKAVPEAERLPYIVVIIDELADLMMTVQKEVEDSIMRIAQMARAAGIHLIVATQRPSVDVVTGLIKANLPSRIAFQVASKTDSRTILDANGAESLLGKGDMLFLPPGSPHLIRVHGCYVSEEEIKRVVEVVKKQGKPNYELLQQRVKEVAEAATQATEEGEHDEEYERAVDLVMMNGQASTSFIQRRLRVGYNRAARMIEMMEKDGIVGPADGSKPRKVLVRKNMDGTERDL